MRRRLTYAISAWILAGVLWPAPSGARAGEGGGPTGLKAFCREGQTFLTWQEAPALQGERYRVYCAEEPITADNLDKARLIAKVPEGSNRFGFLRNLDTDKPGFFNKLRQEKWCRAIQIEDDENSGKQLADGTGLLVTTVKKDGRRCYAVTVEKDGRENRSVRPGANSLEQEVDEKVAPPGAVLLARLKPGEPHFMYAIFCDYEVWNPDGVDDNWDGYVHVFQVRVPEEKHRDAAGLFALSFRLHAYTAWGDWNINYCYPATHVDCRMLDYHLTWWWGYSDALPRREEGKPHPPKAAVVNFTERRVLQVARWLARHPANFPAKVDPERISVFGGSMGGTGANFVGLRNGDVFAAAFSDEGINNWALDAKSNPWAGNIAAKVGPRERNDLTDEGIPVYDLLDLPRWVAAHPERELPFLATGNGSIDTVIPFCSVVDFWKGLEKGRHAYAAAWEMRGHSPWVGSGSPMDYRLIRRDEVLPAFANASCNTPLASGWRFLGRAGSFAGKTLKLETGSLPPDLAGKTLVLAPSGVNRTFFKVKSSTDTELTVEDGDLAAFLPKLDGWSLHCLRQEIAKKEGKEREPTEDEKLAVQQTLKKSLLLTDGEPRGVWNGYFAWSTRAQNFDPKSAADDIVDEEKRLAVSIRLAKNSIAGEWREETAMADVTPRRCRKFRPGPGEKVHWENLDCSDPANPRKVAEGEVTADQHGLVTVPGFKVGKKGWGNRLVMTRQ